MPQLLQANVGTAALVALLAAQLSAAYGQPVDVQEAGSKDFDDEGNLVLRKVAVRVQFGRGRFGPARDITRTTLSNALEYRIICRHESLRGDAEMRNRTLALLECCAERLAGARLPLPDGTFTEGVLLQAVAPVEDAYGPVENCYGLSIEVTGYAQYAGVNSTISFAPAVTL